MRLRDICHRAKPQVGCIAETAEIKVFGQSICWIVFSGFTLRILDPRRKKTFFFLHIKRDRERDITISWESRFFKNSLTQPKFPYFPRLSLRLWNFPQCGNFSLGWHHCADPEQNVGSWLWSSVSLPSLLVIFVEIGAGGFTWGPLEATAVAIPAL